MILQEIVKPRRHFIDEMPAIAGKHLFEVCRLLQEAVCREGAAVVALADSRQGRRQHPQMHLHGGLQSG